MPLPRNPTKQAELVMRGLNKIRHKKPRDKKGFDINVYSVRSYNHNFAAIERYARDMRARHGITIDKPRPEQVLAYLERRAVNIEGSTLSQDRCALMRIKWVRDHGPAFIKQLKAIQPEKAARPKKSKAYRPEQIVAIQGCQTPRNADATQIAWKNALRAHELLTSAPAIRVPKGEDAARYPKECQPTDPDEWNHPRFKDVPDGGSFQVITGKGGLRRLHYFDAEDTRILNRYLRLDENGQPAPVMIDDRGTDIRSHYTLPGGQSWSQSVSSASRRALGFSHGAHGLRHTGAQEMVASLIDSGMDRDTAFTHTSHDMGHKRTSITLVYLI